MSEYCSFSYCRLNDFQEFRLSPYMKSEVRGYFTNLRVDRKTLPKGWYAYDIGGSSSGNIGGSIVTAGRISVNHVGTFLTKTPVRMTKRDHNPDIGGYRHVGSYTFGFDDAMGCFDESLVNVIIGIWHEHDQSMLSILQDVAEDLIDLTPWDIEYLLDWSGELTGEISSDLVLEPIAKASMDMKTDIIVSRKEYNVGTHGEVLLTPVVGNTAPVKSTKETITGCSYNDIFNAIKRYTETNGCDDRRKLIGTINGYGMESASPVPEIITFIHDAKGRKGILYHYHIDALADKSVIRISE